VLEEFLSYPGPAFLEVIIDPEADVYPMVGPGLPYTDIVTGAHIPNRYADAQSADGEAAEPDSSEMF
jgi:acetolactate synthase-1/2/3 large subunit